MDTGDCLVKSGSGWCVGRVISNMADGKQDGGFEEIFHNLFLGREGLKLRRVESMNSY